MKLIFATTTGGIFPKHSLPLLQKKGSRTLYFSLFYREKQVYGL